MSFPFLEMLKHDILFLRHNVKYDVIKISYSFRQENLTLFHMGQKIFGEHGRGRGEGGEGRFCPPPVTFQFVNLLGPNL